MFQIKLLYIYNIYEDKYNFFYNFKAVSNSLERRYYKNVSKLKKYIKTDCSILSTHHLVYKLYIVHRR